MTVEPAERPPLAPPRTFDARWIGLTPRAIRGPATVIEHPLSAKRYQTPLRYPGAKSGLSKLIGEQLSRAAAHPAMGRIELLVEPFAGGASTSLRLLGSGVVERAILADADPLVAAFWQVAAAEPEWLIARMREEHACFVEADTQFGLRRWDYWREWVPSAGMSDRTARFEMAIRCLFLNRTTFSGILHGRAGPIGGRQQTSDYKLGCRFNPDDLADRIAYVGHLYAAHRIVDVWCLDWRETLAQTASTYKTLLPDRVVAYLDPPYMQKSPELYRTAFDTTSRAVSEPAGWPGPTRHEDLAKYLLDQMRYRWVLSYDHDPHLLESSTLYARGRLRSNDALHRPAWPISKGVVSLHYSASRTGRGRKSELLLSTLPPSTFFVPGVKQLPKYSPEVLFGPRRTGSEESGEGR